MIPLLYIRAAIAAAILSAIVGVGWFLYDWAYDKGAAVIQSQWDAEKKETDKQSAILRKDAAATTAELIKRLEGLRKTKDAQINRLNADLATAYDSLRDRPARDSDGGVPKDTATGAALGSTGAGLLRDDASFLAWYSAQTKRLHLQLAECQVAYNNAYKALTPRE